MASKTELCDKSHKFYQISCIFYILFEIFGQNTVHYYSHIDWFAIFANTTDITAYSSCTKHHRSQKADDHQLHVYNDVTLNNTTNLDYMRPLQWYVCLKGKGY